MEQEDKSATPTNEKSNVVALIPKKKANTVEKPLKIDPLKPIEDPLKTSLIDSAKNFINEYEKYTAIDYANLIETVDSLAKNLLEKGQIFKSYKVYHAKQHLNQSILLRSLANKEKDVEEDCSLHMLDFLEEIESV